MTLTLLGLLVLVVVLSIVGFLIDLNRADTARTLAAVQACQRDEGAP